MEQETQLSLTNRATHLCSMQWHGLPPKTHPSPYVLPREFCRFMSKCVNINRGKQKIGEHWPRLPPPLPNVVVLRQRVY